MNDQTDESDENEESARLRAERDELQRQLDAVKRPKRHRARGITAAVLVVVTALVFGAAVTAVWTRVNTLNTERFVKLVGPLGSDPEVQAALADNVAAQVQSVIDARGVLEDALPPRAQLLATPLASAFDGYVSDRVDQFFASDRFEQLWLTAVERVHDGVLKVLEGDAENVEIVDGEVVLNLIPVLNEVLTRLESQVSGILGRDVNLPEITPGMLPDEARTRIENAIGRDLPEDWGTVTVFESDKLTAMQDALQAFRRGTALLAVLPFLFLALTLAISPRRRRTLLQLALAIGVVIVLLRRVVFAAQDSVLDAVRREENRQAVSDTMDHILGGYLGLTVAILWACAAIAVIAFLAGPSRTAVAFRRTVVGGAQALSGAARRTGDEVGSLDWVQAHREPLQVGVGIAGVLFLLVSDLSFWGLLVLIAVVAAIEFVLWRAAPAGPDEGDGRAPEPPVPGGPVGASPTGG